MYVYFYWFECFIVNIDGFDIDFIYVVFVFYWGFDCYVIFIVVVEVSYN